ncbi:MAG: cytochrome c [Pseudomonadota bacterium]
MKPTFFRIAYCIAASVAVTTSAAFAHEGVKNPAVMARMHGMKDIAKELKVLGRMANGATAFDQTTAKTALVSMARHAGEAPTLFEAPEDDPKSEALPAIWEDFEDFTNKAIELETIASNLASSVTSLDDLAPGLQKLAANCKSCHTAYREPNQ